MYKSNINTETLPQSILNNESVSFKNNRNNIGIILNKISIYLHIIYIYSKVHFILHQLHQVRINLTTERTKIRLGKSLIMTPSLYADVFWDAWITAVPKILM